MQCIGQTITAKIWWLQSGLLFWTTLRVCAHCSSNRIALANASRHFLLHEPLGAEQNIIPSTLKSLCRCICYGAMPCLSIFGVGYFSLILSSGFLPANHVVWDYVRRYGWYLVAWNAAAPLEHRTSNDEANYATDIAAVSIISPIDKESKLMYRRFCCRQGC